MDNYEKPVLEHLGSVADFTRGEGWRGDADSFTFHIGRFNITINYGQS